MKRSMWKNNNIWHPVSAIMLQLYLTSIIPYLWFGWCIALYRAGCLTIHAWNQFGPRLGRYCRRSLIDTRVLELHLSIWNTYNRISTVPVVTTKGALDFLFKTEKLDWSIMETMMAEFWGGNPSTSLNLSSIFKSCSRHCVWAARIYERN